MEFGEKIKQLRLERKMTLEDVGNIVGVGKSTVRKWENGMIANMRRDKIAKLAVALGTTPAYLMGWKEPSGSVESCPPLLSPSEDNLLRNYRTLDLEDRQQVDMIMETFVSKEKYKKDAAGRIA